MATTDPFRSHLVALLSIYELGPFPGAPIPRYDGPADWQTEMILKSLGVVAKRMWDAEAAVVSIGGLNKAAKLKRDGDEDGDQWRTVVSFAFMITNAKG